MAQVTVRINGYAYTVGCEDGQEQHLTDMAAEVEKRIVGIRALGGQNGEARLLMFAALMLADEMHDLQTAAAVQVAPAPAEVPMQAAPAVAAPVMPEAPVVTVPVFDEEFVLRLGLVAEEAERIAEFLERT